MAYIKSSNYMIFDSQSDLIGRTADIGQLALTLDLQKLFEFNGTTWMPFSTSNIKKSVIIVNGKATGVTKIYTMETSTLKFYPLIVVFRSVNISGVTIAPTVSVGTNASSYNNIVTGSLLTTLLSTLSIGSGAPQNATISVPISGATDIYANVTIAAVATNYSFTVEILGFYDT